MNVCVRTLTAVVWKWFITLSVSNWGTGTSFRWPILLMICSDLDLLPHGTRETKLTMIWTRFTVISNIKLAQNFVFNENKIQTSLMTGVLFVSLRACQVWWQSPGGSRSPSKILPGDSQVTPRCHNDPEVRQEMCRCYTETQLQTGAHLTPPRHLQQQAAAVPAAPACRQRPDGLPLLPGPGRPGHRLPLRGGRRGRPGHHRPVQQTLWWWLWGGGDLTMTTLLQAPSTVNIPLELEGSRVTSTTTTTTTTTWPCQTLPLCWEAVPTSWRTTHPDWTTLSTRRGSRADNTHRQRRIYCM